MKIKIILFQIVIFLLLSCETPDRDNPYDSESNKEIWTPTNFQAIQEENSVKLLWSSPTVNFTGFRISKKINNGAVIALDDLPKNISQLIDYNISGGEQHFYSIVAYAGDNESNVVYAQITPIIQANISTLSPSQIGTKTATVSGAILSNGGSVITESGFCWSKNINPTITDNKLINKSGLNNFEDVIMGLDDNTTYYIRAFAANNQGVSYGNEESFTTLGYGNLTDIDNNQYNTITIGSQVWMVENLKTTKYKDGTSIPYVTGSWYNVQTPSYCWYNNDVVNKNIYGALYNFYAVNTGNLAPTGWHVSTDSEWSVLINYLGGPSEANAKLREVGISHWTSPNTGATNESGFTALPGGMKAMDGLGGNFYNSIGSWAYWWCSTIDGSTNAKYRSLAYAGAFNGEGDGSSYQFKNGFSVRCVKD
jgi:uncharacterized protein (TIGR02145 family)